jgi:type II secretory pathway pseudopilin PulG
LNTINQNGRALHSPSYRTQAFSLFELVIVIAIIALVTTIVVPRISPKKELRKEFMRQLNILLEVAYNHAQISGKIQRLYFDFIKQTVTLEEEQKERTASGERLYKPVSLGSMKTSLTWPEKFALQSFYVNEKVDLGVINNIYFIIMPNGLSQRVVINIQDIERNEIFAYILNPYTLQFKEYDEMQKT